MTKEKPADAGGDDLHVLARDDDGHWYVIPAAQRETFSRIVASEPDELPGWAVPVNGHPGLVMFGRYSIGGGR